MDAGNMNGQPTLQRTPEGRFVVTYETCPKCKWKQLYRGKFGKLKCYHCHWVGVEIPEAD